DVVDRAALQHEAGEGFIETVEDSLLDIELLHPVGAHADVASLGAGALGEPVSCRNHDRPPIRGGGSVRALHGTKLPGPPAASNLPPDSQGAVGWRLRTG